MEINVGNTNVSISLNEDFRHKVMPVTIVVGVVMVIGVVGNIVVLRTYGFRYETSTYRSFIVYLAMIDLLSCLFAMPSEIYSEMFWFEYGSSGLCTTKSFFNIFVVAADVFAILTIAIDRYNRISRPEKVLISSSSAAYICVCITIVAIAYATPGAVFDGLMHENILFNGQNVTATLCATRDHFKTSKHHFNYFLFLEISIGVSLISMLFIFSVTLIQLYKSSPTNSSEDEQCKIVNKRPDRLEPGTRRQTIILFCISIFFALTIGTYLSMDIYRLHESGDRFGNLSTKESTLFILFWRLYYVNHAVNPLVYGCLDPGFRQRMKSENLVRKSVKYEVLGTSPV